MKLYKEPTILVSAIVVAIVIIIAVLIMGPSDNGVTVDNIVPTQIQLDSKE